MTISKLFYFWKRPGLYNKLEGTHSLIVMSDKTTERFKRPSFSLLIKRWEEHEGFATKNKTPQETLIMNNTCGLGPKVYDIEKNTYICCSCRREDSLSSHWQWGGCVASLKPNPGILLDSIQRQRDRQACEVHSLPKGKKHSFSTRKAGFPPLHPTVHQGD